jgi:ATPase family protein associated with various cellular activities (AAA)
MRLQSGVAVHEIEEAEAASRAARAVGAGLARRSALKQLGLIEEHWPHLLKWTLGQLALNCTPGWTGGIVGAVVQAQISWGACYEKYIGETEKNLRSVFAAAEDSAPILLFDEADTLLGRSCPGNQVRVHGRCR